MKAVSLFGAVVVFAAALSVHATSPAPKTAPPAAKAAAAPAAGTAETAPTSKEQQAKDACLKQDAKLTGAALDACVKKHHSKAM